MAVRPIDANELYRIEKLLDTDIVRQDKVALNLLEQVLYDIQHVPTFTPQDEWVSVDDRLPDVGDLVVYADRIAWGYQYGIRRISRDDRVFRKERSFSFWMPLPEPTDKGDEQ